MKFYRNFLLIYLCLLLNNGHNIVESKPITNNGNRNIHSRGDSTVYRPVKNKPRKPPPDRDISRLNEQVSTIHLIRVNVNTKHNTDEFDYSYNISNKTHSYTATDGHLFKKVKDGRKTLWRSKQGKFADKITVKDKDDGDRSIRVFVPIDVETSDSELENEGNKLHKNSKSSSKKHLHPTTEDSKLEPTFDFEVQHFKRGEKSENSIKLVVVDINNKFNTNKIYYERNDLDDLHIFIARDPYLIGRVRRGSQVLWDYSDGHFAEEVIISYDKSGKPVLRINFAKNEPESDYDYDFSRRSTLQNGIENELSLSPLPSVPVTPTEKQVDVSSPGVVTPQSSPQDALSPTEGQTEVEFQVDDTKYEEPKLTPLIVDINVKQSNKYIIHEYDSEKHTHTFTATESYFIYMVKKGEDKLWESKDGIYPEKILILKDEFGHSSLRLQFPKQVTPEPELKSKHKPEPEPEPGPKVKPPEPLFITIDIKNKFNTTQYTYEYDKFKDIYTFTPNPGFIINKVMKGVHQMWEYEYGLYPEKVLILKDEFNNPVLRLQFPIHKPVLVPELVPRIEVAPPEPIKVEEEVDLTKHPIDVDINIERNTEFFDYSYKMNVGTFTPRHGCAFKSIKESRGYACCRTYSTIWHTTDPREYLKKIDFYYNNNILTLYFFNGKIKKLKKFGKVWVDYTHVRPTIKTPISLDIECKHNTYFFDYSKEGDTEIYKPKPEYIFKQVKRVPVPSILGLDAIIWRTDNSDMFSNRVELTNNNSVTVFSVDGFARVFKKSPNNGWDLTDEYNFLGNSKE